LPIELAVDSCAVFFVVDRSGTAASSLEDYKRLIEATLPELGPKGEFGIVFVDRGTLQYPLKVPPAKADASGRKAATDFLRGVRMGPGSCPLEGFIAALEFADKATAGRKIIYYLGDGGGTCRGMKEEDYLELTSDTIAQRNHGRVEIHALAVGAAEVSENFLLFLTDKHGGSYTRGL
jgi:hypothetical protein